MSRYRATFNWNLFVHLFWKESHRRRPNRLWQKSRRGQQLSRGWCRPQFHPKDRVGESPFQKHLTLSSHPNVIQRNFQFSFHSKDTGKFGTGIRYGELCFFRWAASKSHWEPALEIILLPDAERTGDGNKLMKFLRQAPTALGCTSFVQNWSPASRKAGPSTRTEVLARDDKLEGATVPSPQKLGRPFRPPVCPCYSKS